MIDDKLHSNGSTWLGIQYLIISTRLRKSLWYLKIVVNLVGDKGQHTVYTLFEITLYQTCKCIIVLQHTVV